MKILFTFSFYLLFACCTSSDMTSNGIHNDTAKVVTFQFVDSLLKKEKVCIDKYETIITYLDTIEYNYRAFNIFFGKDTIIFCENATSTIELIYFKKTLLERIKLKDSEFNIDSMDMAIDYDFLEICSLKNDDNYLIIKTIPYNWVGLMIRCRLYQIINKKEKYVIQFVKEG